MRGDPKECITPELRVIATGMRQSVEQYTLIIFPRFLIWIRESTLLVHTHKCALRSAIILNISRSNRDDQL